jgi:hypothetical protein
MKDSLKQYVSLHQSLNAEKSRLEARLKDINQALSGSVKVTAKGKPFKKKKFSAAARAAIAAAQRARWAKIKAAKK